MNLPKKVKDRVKETSVSCVLGLIAFLALIEACAFAYNYMKTKLVSNLSLLWRPIVLTIMIFACCSKTKTWKDRSIKFLAIIYSVVTISDLTCFYLVIILTDWDEYADKVCAVYPSESENPHGNQTYTYEQCFEDVSARWD